MKFIPAILLFSLFLISCQKEKNRRLLGAYFKLTVNGGAEKKIEDGAGLYDNTFDCIIKGDTALYIDARKQYEGAGFSIVGKLIKDSTYTLDSMNIGYYSNPVDYKRYETNSLHKGTLTIKKGTFEAASTLNTLEGSFTYQVVDTATGKTFDIGNGSFLMERHEE